ncbi:alpha/beta hydrolase family protein [Streptomyces sp. NPDC057002]|uniref:alpha/beta hydrolase family protein n=1 Tax=Streptomyces sp. NPDC057002 TaxID=3345992 RepID=UPI0036435F53
MDDTRAPRDTWQRADTSHDLSAWALITTPVHPSLRESHPDLDLWGELRVDPGLVGLDTGRARPLRVEIGCRDHENLWRLPVEAVVPSALAWHPRLPLVAGLAVRGRHAHPWVADYRARTVTVHARVRAATSLTGLGGSGQPPLAWCGNGLVVLTPVTPEDAGAERSPSAAVCEATGPGWIAFPQAVPELSAGAAVRVAALNSDDGALRPLTGPLLVRGLEPAPGGGHLLITHLDEKASHSLRLRWAASVADASDRDTHARRVAPGSRWATGAPDVLAWPDDSEGGRRILMCGAADRSAGDPVSVPAPDEWWPLWHGGAPWVLGTGGDTGAYLASPEREVPLPAPDGLRLGRPCPARDPSAGFLLDCRSGDGGYGIATLDPEHPGRGLTLTWASDQDARTVRAFSGPSGQGLTVESPTRLRRLLLADGTLTSEHVTTWATGRPAGKPLVTLLLPGRERPPVGLTLVDCAENPGRPLLLWLRAQEPGAGGEPARCPGAGPVAHLDLVPLWPADATAGFLHTQITGAVRDALDALARHRPGILDRGVVVGGHSFGASLALYALAHVRRLDGAIVHSGCYNRTLTPGGFQYERRSYWQAPEIYHAFSALLFAHRLEGPVLIAHGTRDANPATAPEQAVGLYRGVVAAGGQARLVLLPGEGHNFQYAETHRTLATEHGRWLDLCARTPEPVVTHPGEEVAHVR